eukprot:g12429.t1
MRRNRGRKVAKPKPPNYKSGIGIWAKFQAGPPDGEELFTFEEYDSWAVSSYYSEELSTEEKAKRRDLSMFVKYHLIPKVVSPVDTASPFPGWTLFAGPDDDLDDEDFYQDEVVVEEEERAGEKKQAGEKGKDKGSGKEEDKEQAGEKGRDKAEEEESDGEVLHRGRVPRSKLRVREAARPPKPAARASKGLVSHVSGRDEAQASIKCRIASSAPGAGRRRGGGEKHKSCQSSEIATVCLFTGCVPAHPLRQLNVPGWCARCQSKRPCDEHGAVSRPSHGTGLVSCAKASGENKLKLHDQFCSKCGAGAPKNLLEAAAGLGPRVWDAKPPLDPAWDREWKVEPVQQNDHLWYYRTVTTAPDKDDGLVALYCVVLAAPEQKYRSGKGKHKVPWFQVVVEVMEMRVSKEIPTDFQIRGVTPKPEVARAWDGSKSPEANHKLVVDRVSIPELIKAWKTKSRIIMLFNIATYRQGVTSYIHGNREKRYTTRPRTVSGLMTKKRRMKKRLRRMSRLSAWDQGKM